MINREQVKAELTMRIRFAAGGTTPVSATLLESTLELLEEDEKKLAEKWAAHIGRWVKPDDRHDYCTAGGDPVYCCEKCGGSHHVYGVEHPKRKFICDNCGSINLYPWEKSYDETSSLAQN